MIPNMKTAAVGERSLHPDDALTPEGNARRAFLLGAAGASLAAGGLISVRPVAAAESKPAALPRNVKLLGLASLIPRRFISSNFISVRYCWKTVASVMARIHPRLRVAWI